MRLTSLGFENNSLIPSKYTCDSDSISPPLNFYDVPEHTQSFVLIVHDPDAPSGHFLHWIMWDIDPDVDNIQENGVPWNAIQGINSAGNIGYIGPCPPSGTHRYIFTLYALSRQLSLPFDTVESEILESMEGYVLDKAELIGLYTKQKKS